MPLSGGHALDLLHRKPTNRSMNPFSGHCRTSPSARTIAGSYAKRVRTVSVKLALWKQAHVAIAVRAAGRCLYPQRKIQHQIPACCRAMNWIGKLIGGITRCRPADILAAGKEASCADDSPLYRQSLFWECVHTRPPHACRQRGRQQVAKRKKHTTINSPLEYGLP